jgi:hypothetical protein
LLTILDFTLRRRLEEVTKELSKYQELLARDAQSTAQSSFGENSQSDGQSSAPQTVDPSGMSIISETSSSVLAMNVLMSGVCFRAGQDDLGAQPEHFVLGDVHLDKHAAFILFQE